MRTRNTVIHDNNEIINLIYTKRIFSTNIKCLKDESKLMYLDYILEYDLRLKDVEQSFKDGRRNIKCYKYEIAFEYTKDIKYLKKLVNNVIKYISGDSFVLEYITFINDRRSCISIIIFDRYFYPDGKLIEEIAKNDWKNGKFKKGDVVRKKKIYCSAKLRIFNFSTKKQLALYFEILRGYLIDNKFEEYDSGIVSDKILKAENNKYFRVKRRENFYSQIADYRSRKIRAINMLIRSLNMNRDISTKDITASFKKRINSSYDVYKFELEVVEIIFKIMSLKT